MLSSPSRPLILAASALLAVLAALPASADPPRLRTEGSAFRDALGRHVILRGMNARVEGIFDSEDFPLYPFGEAEARRFAELGFNLLRLPVNWSGIEPEPLAYDEAYLDRVDAIIELGRRHGFYVLVDMHQDAHSKFIGEDGAPLWSIVPQPPPGWVPPPDINYRLVPLVLLAGFSFINDVPATDGRPQQSAFIAAVQRIVARHVGDPVVAGYEALNEPVVLDAFKLDAFHRRFATGVRALDPHAVIFYEPITIRNQLDWAPTGPAPWAPGNGAYSPHIYTTVFSPPNDEWASEDPEDLRPSMERAVAEAAAWNSPLFVGEFGMSQELERGHRFLEAQLDLQDRFLASSTVWVWRESGSWGLFDGAGNERPATARVLSRPYPRAIAGRILSIERPAEGQLTVRYRERDDLLTRTHELGVSSTSLLDAEVRCDGRAVPVRFETGRALFECPASARAERTIELIGTPRPLSAERPD